MVQDTRHGRNFAKAACIATLSLCSLIVGAAPDVEFSPVPLFVAPVAKPNMLLILDNSQSMDATMGGMLIDGTLEHTRSNTARRILRSILDEPIADTMNWGLATFGTLDPPPDRYLTNAYWLGNEQTMRYTATCVNGVSTVPDPRVSGQFLRCTENPEPGNGYGYITYEVAGDDPAVNDVIYTSRENQYRYVIADGGSYYWYPDHRESATSQTWAAADFTGTRTSTTLSRTDTGFGPSPAQYSRVLLKRRAWGYLADVTGTGRILESVKALDSAHLNALKGHLAYELDNLNSNEIKNSALFTPLAGSMLTAKDYFRGANSSRPSPISVSCQRKNYVVLATDGNPTAKTDGSDYSTTEIARGDHKTDVYNQIRDLAAGVTLSGNVLPGAPVGERFEVKTYIVGMGVPANVESQATLNEMARLGGTVKAFRGDTEESLADAFKAIFEEAGAPQSGSAVAINSSAYQAGTAIYQAKFQSSNWSGNLLSFAAERDGTISARSSWAVGVGDARKEGAAPVLKDQHWDMGRRIITANASSGAGVPFRWPANPSSPTNREIDASQVAALNADGLGALRLRYLRGDAANEVGCSGDCPRFRKRADGPLGDIVNSAPTFVGPPAFGYPNNLEARPYSSFVADKRERRSVVYVGANDGMLHAFDAGFGTTDRGTGAELFAFVPSAVFPNLSQLSDRSYSHRYFVDGTPTVADVFFQTANDWRTLLVSGMRAGAKGLFALDVTDPSVFNSETNAASIVKWEFRGDADMGHVFGQPLLVKTNHGGRWAVIVSNGYESTGGKAVLYVIDAEDGSVIKKLDTGSGTNNGLSAPTAIDTNGDGVVDLVYAGDLNGNLWKFDIGSTSRDSWTIGFAGAPLFQARFPRGSSVPAIVQPITSAPDVTRHPRGGYLVAFGTGRYFAVADNLNTEPQSVYAIWDKPAAGTVVRSDVRNDLQRQSIVDERAPETTGGIAFRLSTHAVGEPADPKLAGVGLDGQVDRTAYFADKRGWFLDLPTTRERAVADVAFRFGRLIVVSIIPGTTCEDPDGTSWLMEFDAITGNRLDVLTFDINRDSNLTRGVGTGPAGGDYLVFARGSSSGNNVTGQSLDGIVSGQTTVGRGSLTLEDRVFSTSGGAIDKRASGRGQGGTGRAMWREVR
jgi:type IV pilus assembly protein PilY1